MRDAVELVCYYDHVFKLNCENQDNNIGFKHRVSRSISML